MHIKSSFAAKSIAAILANSNGSKQKTRSHTHTQAHLACIHTYAPLIFVSTFLSHTHTLAHWIRLAWLCVLHNCRHIVFCALTFLALEFQIIFPFTFALNSFSKFHRKRTQRAVTAARHTTIQFFFSSHFFLDSNIFGNAYINYGALCTQCTNDTSIQYIYYRAIFQCLKCPSLLSLTLFAIRKESECVCMFSAFFPFAVCA